MYIFKLNNMVMSSWWLSHIIIFYFKNFRNMDKKGYLLRMSSTLCALYDLSFFCFLNRSRHCPGLLCQLWHQRGQEDARYSSQFDRPLISWLLVDGNCELITAINAISASVAIHHPTILLKGKTLQGCWLTHHIPGVSYGNIKHGWTINE